MTKKAHAMKKTTALLLGCLLSLPSLAQAAPERRSPLTNAPAIRKRVELRSSRFELGVGAAATINQDFYNATLLNVRASYHFNDWFGLSVSGGVLNLTPDMKTSFHNQLSTALQSSRRPGDTSDKTPTPADAAAAANRINMIISPGFDWTFFAGKFALFSKLFMNYDVYLITGASFVNLVKKGDVDSQFCAAVDGKPPRCEAFTGMKIGGNVGVGMHAFATDYFALNIEARDVIYKNNAAGRDVNGDGFTDSHDLTWTHNWLLGLNATFFLPAKARISN
jgi:outer membrane beta-barrel protein